MLHVYLSCVWVGDRRPLMHRVDRYFLRGAQRHSCTSCDIAEPLLSLSHAFQRLVGLDTPINLNQVVAKCIEHDRRA